MTYYKLYHVYGLCQQGAACITGGADLAASVSVVPLGTDRLLLSALIMRRLGIPILTLFYYYPV